MKHFKQLLTQPLKVRTSAVIFLLVVALIGFVDASYLSYEHFQGVVPPCSVTKGCEQVLTSSYAVVLGMPVSLLGAIYYLLVLAGIFAYFESKHQEFLRYALLFTVFGFIASLWFVYLQVFIIHSYCAYCMGSALTSTILFVTAIILFMKNNKITNNQTPIIKE